jgi:O-methyltransferase involved in polyketide biosynthesis
MLFSSRTAWRVALRRAAHQTLDAPPIFHDPLALRIVGGQTGKETSTDLRLFLDPSGLGVFLQSLGFGDCEDLSREGIKARYGPQLLGSAHLMRARNTESHQIA